MRREEERGGWSLRLVVGLEERGMSVSEGDLGGLL